MEPDLSPFANLITHSFLFSELVSLNIEGKVMFLFENIMIWCRPVFNVFTQQSLVSDQGSYEITWSSVSVWYVQFAIS